MQNLTEDIDGDGTEDAFDDDIDGDGVSNADEEAQGSDPLDPSSTNRSPSSLSASETLSVSEDLSVGSVITTFTGTDPDGGDSLSYSMVPLLPSSLAPTLWLDASDADSLMTFDGKVLEWTDKSSGNHHFIQNSLNKRPNSGTRNQNGLNVVDFDGGENLSTNSNFATGTNFSIFLVAGIDAINDAADSLLAYGNNDPDFQLQASRNSEFRFHLSISGSSGSHHFSPTPHNGPGIYGLVFDLNQSVVSGYMNGLFRVPANTSRSSTKRATSSDSFQPRTKPVSHGFAAELLVYGSALGDSDRRAVENYLGHVALPSGNSPDKFFFLESNGTLKSVGV